MFYALGTLPNNYKTDYTVLLPVQGGFMLFKTWEEYNEWINTGTCLNCGG